MQQVSNIVLGNILSTFINVMVNRLLDEFPDEIYRVYGNVSRDSSPEWTADTKATKEVHGNTRSV